MMGHLHRSRLSSRITSRSREPSPFDQFSTHDSHVSSSSTNVQGRVQSRTTTTSVWSSDDRGGRKWGNKAVYEVAEEGTV